MGQEFEYDVFLSRSANDKAVVQPLAERKRQGRSNPHLSGILPSAFILLPSPLQPSPVAAEVTRLGSKGGQSPLTSAATVLPQVLQAAVPSEATHE